MDSQRIDAFAAVEIVLFARSHAVRRVRSARGDSRRSHLNFFWKRSAK